MATLGTLNVNIDANMGGFNRGMRDAELRMDAFQAKVAQTSVATRLLSGHFNKLESDSHPLTRGIRDVELATGKATQMSFGFAKELENTSTVATEASTTLSGVVKQTQASGTAATQAGGGFASMGPVMLAVVAGVVALVAVLAPFIFLVITATFAVSAFAVGLTAVLSVMALAGGGVLALGAGIFLLAEKTGMVVGPIAELSKHASDMANVLGKQAAPMAELIIRFLDRLLPMVQGVGSALLSWFGERLPGILKGATDVAEQFFGALEGLGGVFGRFLDQVGARAPQFTVLFSLIMGFGIDAVDGLLKNLLRLSDWFIAQLPTLGPIVAQIFGWIGSAIQTMAGWSERFVNWIVANWPQIVGTANTVWQAIQSIWRTIQEGWAVAQPQLARFQESLRAFGPILEYVQNNAGNLKGVLIVLGVVIALLVISFGTIVMVSIAVVAALIWIAGKVGEAVAQWQRAAIDVGNAIARINGWVQAHWQMVVITFNSLMAFLAGVWAWLTTTHMITWSQIWSTVVRFLAGIWNSVVGTWNGLMGYLGGVGANLTGWAWNTWSSIWNSVTSWAGKTRDTVQGIWDGMAGAASSAGNAIWNNIKSGLNDAIGALQTFLGKAHDALGTFGFPNISINKFARGGRTSGPSLAGEGGPEWVIPTNPAYRSRAVGLLGAAASELGLGPELGGISATIGAIGGQCVEFIQRMLGLSYHGNANTWVNAPYAHTQTAKPGEVAVFTGGPYGHVAIVTGPGDGYSFPVIDSNWVAPLTIGTHTMSKGMYGFATFLDPGTSAPGGISQMLAGIPGVTSPIDLLNGLVSKTLGGIGLGGWAGALAKGVINSIVGGIKSVLHFDQGGEWPTGTLGFNGSGSSEQVFTGSQMSDLAAKLDEQTDHLAALRRKLLGQVVVNNQGERLSPAEVMRQASFQSFVGAV